jgi:hypothetical protein
MLFLLVIFEQNKRIIIMKAWKQLMGIEWVTIKLKYNSKGLLVVFKFHP